MSEQVTSPLSPISKKVRAFPRVGLHSLTALILAELLKTQLTSPQRLSAVIDPSHFAGQMSKMKSDILPERTSADSEAPSIIAPLPVIEVSNGVYDVSPPLSPSSSMTDNRRKSRSSVMLLDRLAVPSSPDFGSWECGANTVEGGQQPSPPKNYDNILTSRPGVVKLGQGYQSDRSIRKTALEYQRPSTAMASPPSSNILRRSSLFRGLSSSTRGLSSGVNKSAEPMVAQRPTVERIARSFDDIGARKQAGSRLGQLKASEQPRPSYEASTVASRMKRAFQMLTTPRRSRTMAFDH